ncbi:MAG: hypothetical protein DRR42_22060 [Gammaproteobacteria bacterium]|nr:MAG: hypothetical protein DRR42_22060 [Gammaproteobacteria bacterium]
MKILVTDGNSRAALAVVRSLGSLGHELFVASTRSQSIASCSRYCSYKLSYPDPTIDRAAFIKSLLNSVIEHDIDILLPITDVSIFPVAEHLESFNAYCCVPISSLKSLLRAANKQDIFELADELGVPVPSSITINNAEQCLSALKNLQFPVVIKPTRSRVKDGTGWLNTGVDYADSADELMVKIRSLSQVVFPVSLQERIVGAGIGLFYCFNQGQPISVFSHRRLHEKPPSGGVSVLRESVTPDPQAEAFGILLLRELEWHGVAMVEFKVDRRDNKLKLMEINGRFWGSLQLAIDSGVDFPKQLIDVANGQIDFTSSDYKLGVRSRWFWGEVDLLLLYLLKSKKTLKLPPDHDPRYISILKTINPYVPRQKMEVLRLSDIKPWLYETLNWFKN